MPSNEPVSNVNVVDMLFNNVVTSKEVKVVPVFDEVVFVGEVLQRISHVDTSGTGVPTNNSRANWSNFTSFKRSSLDLIWLEVTPLSSSHYSQMLLN